MKFEGKFLGKSLCLQFEVSPRLEEKKTEDQS